MEIKKENFIDFDNKQAVGMNGNQEVVIWLPKKKMTRSEALVHAAWIVAVTMADEDEFSFYREGILK